jgi:phenylacetic acid degradation operon negative regulatory protein
MSRPGDVTPRMGLICFAFGVAGIPPGQHVAGPLLLRILADLGLHEAAARSLLLRMRREGLLDSERAGRQARYRLAPVITSAQDRLQRQMRGDRPGWTGAFSGVLFEVPERSRDFRDRLRRTAQLLGYVTLRPGLLVATTDHWEELVSILPSPPARSQLLPMSVTLSVDDSRRVAAELWNLESLAARYRNVLAEARDRTDRAEARDQDPAGSLAAFAAAVLPVYEVIADDPDLPAELLLPDWPGDQLGPALHRAFQVFGPMLDDYLAGLAG